jgi:hypothetical protein
LPQQLFALHEYNLALGKFVHTAIDGVRDRIFPLLGQIRTTYVESLHHIRVTVPSGEIVESAPIEYQLSFSIDLKGAVAGDAGSLIDSIGAAAEQKGSLEMRSLEAYMVRVTDAAGTSVDAEGRPLDRQMFLRTMETYDIDFDEEGCPGLPPEVRHLFHAPYEHCTCFTDDRSQGLVLHTSQRMKDYLARLPPPSGEELRAFEELMDRKRREFNDRKRHRQLPQRP